MQLFVENSCTVLKIQRSVLTLKKIRIFLSPGNNKFSITIALIINSMSVITNLRLSIKSTAI